MNEWMIHTHIPSYIRTYIPTYIHTHAHISTYVHTYIHTYIHTHTCIHTRWKATIYPNLWNMLHLLCYKFSFSLMTHHLFFFFYSFTFFLFLFFFSHFTGDWLRAQEAVEDALSLLQQERWVRWSLIGGDDRIWWQDIILYDKIWYDMS